MAERPAAATARQREFEAVSRDLPVTVVRERLTAFADTLEAAEREGVRPAMSSLPGLLRRADVLLIRAERPSFCPHCAGPVRTEEHATFLCADGCGWWIKQEEWSPAAHEGMVRDALARARRDRDTAGRKDEER